MMRLQNGFITKQRTKTLSITIAYGILMKTDISNEM